MSGCILVSVVMADQRPCEEGWVVLQSIAGSPVHCRVAAPLHDGRFAARLPGNAIVTADRVELEERPALVAGETFDIAESTLLRIHVAWAPPTTLRVIDEASGVELRDVRIADQAGRPIDRARLLLRSGEQRELADSLLALAPPFDRRSDSFQWSERLRVGAPGHATEEIEVNHGHGAETTVELGAPARLVVTLTPWPPPRSKGPSDDAGDVHVRVWLSTVKPAESLAHGVLWSFDDDISLSSMDYSPLRGRGWNREGSTRAPDGQGTVTYEDLAGGRWVANVELSRPKGGSVLAHDEQIVDVEPGRSASVTLDLTRPPVAPATLLVCAHDAKDDEPIALEPRQVSVHRVDASRAAIKRSSKEEPRFETTSGAVEIIVRVLGERAWRPVCSVALLAPGDNVVDLALERCAAIRLAFRDERGAITPAIGYAAYRSQMSLFQSLVLRDARGELVSGPWFNGRECWWVVEPGRHDLTTPEVVVDGLDDTHCRTRAVDVAPDAVITIELGEAR